MRECVNFSFGLSFYVGSMVWFMDPNRIGSIDLSVSLLLKYRNDLVYFTNLADESRCITFLTWTI